MEVGSIADTTMTKVTTKSGSGHVHKHCTTGSCNGKRIAGNHWAAHVRDVHAGVLKEAPVNCTEGCHLCE